MLIRSKFPGEATTIFSVMSKLAIDHQAINLAQGFPDFSCSEELLGLACRYMQEGFNQYTPMQGILPLRQALAEKCKKLYNISVNADTEVTITCGATEACNAAISAFIGHEDEVIIFEPAFDSYVPVIRLNGGKPVFVELKYPDFKIDWNEVKEKISARTRMIIINSPHNPTGAIIDKEDIRSLQELVKDTDIIILSDEVYEHIIFDGRAHESLLRYPDLFSRSLVVSSFGKTFHTTGWRLGYCIAPEPLSAEFRKIHQYLTFSAPTPLQYATADFLKNEANYIHLPAFYQQKRDRFLDLLRNSGFTAIPSRGTYFQLLSYKAKSDAHDREMAQWLTVEHGVASIPISCFYHTGKDEKILRFCFAKEDRTLEKAAEKLCKIW